MKILEVPGAIVDDAIVDDPLLGPAHVITCGDKTMTMSAIDWARPTTIPTVAAPAMLATGAGAAIMNAIALRARDAGVTALRYAGRYPTAALWKTLLRSFRTTATEADFMQHFGVARELPIDFTPAPFTRIDNAHGHVEMRDARIERAVVDDIPFEIDGSPTRFVDDRAEVWFGDLLYAHVAMFDAAGRLVDGPHPLPACASTVIGKPFPKPLVAGLAELVADSVPAPLQQAASRFVIDHPIRWADLGARAATFGEGGLAVHAALWERIAPLGLPRLALAIAEALIPVVTLQAVAQIARRISQTK